MITQKPVRIEKYLLVPLRTFLGYSYVRQTEFHGGTIHDARKKRGYMAVLAGYFAAKQRHGWNITIWWLKSYDEPLDPNSVYRNGHQPCEAVNPQEIVLQYFPHRLDEPLIEGC